MIKDDVSTHTTIGIMAVGHFDKKKKCRTIPLMLPVFSDTTIVLSIFLF